MSKLHAQEILTPYKLGDLDLPNRIVMAPLTRNRAAEGGVPTPLMAEYYAQRSSAGLIISEASQISAQGQGYAGTPGIYTDAQLAGWNLVTHAVHSCGGRIFLQLWHVGRISHMSLQPGGEHPVAPSAIRAKAQTFVGGSFTDVSEPHALNVAEIREIVGTFATAAKAALSAGFDGVEIHAANGYLIDQFLCDGSNKRTDEYGGSLENRTRFLLEVTQAVIKEVGEDCVGVRISPVSTANDVHDSDAKALFNHVVERLDHLRPVYLHVIEGQTGGPRDFDPTFDFIALRKKFHRTYMANNGYILVLRAKHPSWGARKLKARLEMLQPELVWPAASTFGNILSRAGLTSPQKKRKRITPCSEPFSMVTGPNQLWCMDFKGYFVTGDGKRCDPFTITDAYSRYLIRCQIVSRIDLSQVRAICEAAMREYGMPARIRTDNGAPFAGTGLMGLSKLALGWMKLGIVHERIQAGRPQQNGRHERMHRTLKEDTTKPPASSLRAQQNRFDNFRYVFNNERPHEGLKNAVPASLYHPSSVRLPRKLPEFTYPKGLLLRKVNNSGDISWHKTRIFISEVFRFEELALELTTPGFYRVYFRDLEVGELNAEELRFRSARRVV